MVSQLLSSFELHVDAVPHQSTQVQAETRADAKELLLYRQQKQNSREGRNHIVDFDVHVQDVHLHVSHDLVFLAVLLVFLHIDFMVLT